MNTDRTLVQWARWLVTLLLIGGGLVCLNYSFFHYWASDVPPRINVEEHKRWGDVFLTGAAGAFLLSGLTAWGLRKK